MPVKGGRINVRHNREYSIKMISKGGNIGEIEELVWFPGSVQEPESGLINVAVSIKFKNLSVNNRCKITDEYNISVEGKSVGGKVNMLSETIQKAKLHTPEGETSPDVFENGKIYTFSGIMLEEKQEEPPQKVAASFRGTNITGRR
jgi:hypothetical protein